MRRVSASLVLGQLLWAQHSSPSLIGRWRSLETSKGGIGATFEFRSDGALDYSPGAIVEENYRIENGELILPSDTKNGPEQKLTIEWLGEDNLRLKAGDKVGDELARKGARVDAKNPIVGEWSGSRQMGANRVSLHWFFYPAGKFLLSIPFTTQHGRYSVDKQTIRIELPDHVVEGRFELQGDVLVLPGPRGTGESRFARY